MTLEEAKQLKPGDYVSAVFVIRAQNSDSIIDEDGELKLVAVEDNGHISTRRISFLAPECVQKTEKPRRKFKKGDIVSRNGHLYYVADDEMANGKVLLDCCGDGIMHTRADLLTLERGVEDRVNRKEEEV